MTVPGWQPWPWHWGRGSAVPPPTIQPAIPPSLPGLTELTTLRSQGCRHSHQGRVKLPFLEQTVPKLNIRQWFLGAS